MSWPRTKDLDFDTALEVNRGGTVFTTHTPVPAGIDRFPVELIQQHFSADAFGPEVPIDRILELGAEDFEGGDPALFNMAIMGLRLAQRANGVSKLHGVVSRGMFSGLWPSFDSTDVPITSITNGVHAPTWVAREIHDLTYANYTADEDIFEGLDKTTDQQIWETKRLLRQRFIDDTRARVRQSWINRGASEAELGWVDSILDPDILTIGFARRVPSYKRLTLMLRDPERLKALLLHPQRPIQIVIAGKAHPHDEGGKKLIQEIVRVRRRPGCTAPDRVRAGLRHRAGAADVPGLRRLAEQPAPPVRGERHVRYEGGAERCTEPVHPRRLVGRVVRRRVRLGDPVRGRSRGHRPA